MSSLLVLNPFLMAGEERWSVGKVRKGHLRDEHWLSHGAGRSSCGQHFTQLGSRREIQRQSLAW